MLARKLYSTEQEVEDSKSHIEITNKSIKSEKIKLNPKIKIYLILFAVVFCFGFYTTNHQQTMLENKQKELKRVQVEHSEVLKEQKELETLILKLSDDEYLMKIARKEYFLSKEGEILLQIEDDKR